MRPALLLLVILSAHATADEQLDAHLDALRVSDEDQRAAAGAALRAAGELARARLEAVLAPAESPGADTGRGRRRARVEAALLLGGELGDRRSIAALATALGGDDAELRAVASFALRSITHGGPKVDGHADDLLLWARDRAGVLAAWRAWLAAAPPAPAGEPLQIPRPTTPPARWAVDTDSHVAWQVDLGEMLERAQAPPPIPARHAGATRCRARFAASPVDKGLALACHTVTTSHERGGVAIATDPSDDPRWDGAALELVLAGPGSPATVFAATRERSPATSDERQLLQLTLVLATLVPDGVFEPGVARPLPPDLCAALSPALYRGTPIPPQLDSVRGRWTYLGREGDLATFALVLACDRTGQYSLVGDRVRGQLAGTLAFDLARGRVRELNLSGPATMAGPAHGNRDLQAKPGDAPRDLTRSPVWIHLATRYVASEWADAEPGK